MALLSVPARAQGAKYDFLISEDSMGAALSSLAQQAHVQLLYPYQLARIRGVRPVNGQYSVPEALDLLLKGTGFSGGLTSQGVITITLQNMGCAKEGKAMTSRSRKTASLIALLFGTFGASGCYAQAAVQAPGEGEVIETVTVTGSRLSTTSAFDQPTPVTVITSDEIKYSGTVNVENLLVASPQFSGSTYGSAHSNTIQTAGQSGVALLDLRHLGSIRSLVLVNGRRYAIQGTNITTDLNTIPTALLERTEIVTGGSSAVYGSDAISGVVNFVMKQHFEGTQVDFEYRFDEPTATPVLNADVTFGGDFAGGKGNAAIEVNYLNRSGYTQAQRGGFAQYQLTGGCVTASSFSLNHAGVANGASANNCTASGGKMGFVVTGSNDTQQGRIWGLPTAATLPAASPLLAAYQAAGLGNLTDLGMTFDGSAVNPTGARPRTSADYYNLIEDNYLQVPQSRWMINAFGHYDVAPKVTAYAEIHFSNNSVNMQMTPSNTNGDMIINANNPYLSPAMQNVLSVYDGMETSAKCATVGSDTTSWCTSPGDGKVLVSYGKRFTVKRTSNSERVAWRFAGGFRGELGSVTPDYLTDVAYDVSYIYARTNLTDHQNGGISRSKLQQSVLSQNGAAPLCDIFGLDNMSPSCVNTTTISSTNLTRSELQDASATINGSAFKLPAGPVDFALGFEWRYTSAEYIPDYFVRSGDVGGLGAANPTAGSDDVFEGFGEVRVPILRDLPYIQKLTANAAFRYSEYNISGAKGVWTYAGGLDWKVIDDLAFRGQYQRAIRAPNVGELYGGQATEFGHAVDPCGASATTRSDAVRNTCIAAGVPAANVFSNAVQGPNDLIGSVTGGNPDLRPEKSETITFGTVITPTLLPGFAFSVDFFSIDVSGAVNSIGTQQTMDLCYLTVQDADSVYCKAIHRNVSSGAVGGPSYVQSNMQNIGGMKTQGVDVNARYLFEVPWGLFGDTSNFDISSAWTWTKEYTVTPYAGNVNQCAGAYSYWTTCGEPMPGLKSVSRVSWSDGPLTLSLRHRYISHVTTDVYLLPLRKGLTPPALDTLTRPVVPPMHYFDLSGSYDISDQLTFYGGINNLLGRDPPLISNSYAPFANTFPSTYDVNGREFFIGITAKMN
jgi:iron complex outermembrane recepter protein